ASMIRNAVVERSDSYGGSIRATVSVFLSIMDYLLLLVPNGFRSLAQNEIYQFCNTGWLYPIHEVPDSALLERKVVRQHLHLILSQLRQAACVVRPSAGREDPILDEKHGHLVSFPGVPFG